MARRTHERSSPRHNSSTAGCDGGRDYVGWDVTAGVVELAADRAHHGSFVLRARDEHDRAAFKHFAHTAHLVVRYASRPDTPTGPETRTGNMAYACGTPDAPTAISTIDQVTLSALLTDDDGNQATLTGIFEGEDLTTGAQMPTSTSSTTSSGQRAMAGWQVEDGHVYRWHVTARNSWTYNGEPGALDSEPSDDCYIRIDSHA